MVKLVKISFIVYSHEPTLEQCLVADIVHIVYKHGCDQDFRIWSYTNYRKYCYTAIFLLITG